MLEAVRALCAECSVPAELALEAGMACGFGACYGCVVPRRGGGYLRVCRRWPGDRRCGTRARRGSRWGARMSVEFCGLASGPPDRQRLGHLRRDRRATGRSAMRSTSGFPFAAFVSKTITLAPRVGNPPPRLWEAQAGLINSIGFPTRASDATWSRIYPSLRACRCR